MNAPKNAPYERLFTHKHALNESRLESADAAPQAAPGEVVLRLDRFALTTNNITYAAFGDAMQYWAFFPTGHDGWGYMPVWGFADVVSLIDLIRQREEFRDCGDAKLLERYRRARKEDVFLMQW